MPDGAIEMLGIPVPAQAVVDASGTWSSPNPLGASGLPAPGEVSLADRIHYGIPDVLGADRPSYEGSTTLVVGAGHSAANSILALIELAEASRRSRVLWATRGSNLARVFGGGDGDGLPERGRLGERLRALVDSGGLAVVTDLRITAVERDRDQLCAGAARTARSSSAGSTAWWLRRGSGPISGSRASSASRSTRPSSRSAPSRR